MTVEIGKIYKEATQWAVDVVIDGTKTQLTFGSAVSEEPTQMEVDAAVLKFTEIPKEDFILVTEDGNEI
jgi:hypothetical protein